LSIAWLVSLFYAVFLYSIWCNVQRLSRRAKRRSRNPSRVILQRAELCAHFQIDEAALEDYLVAHHIPFHVDSNGELWTSLAISETIQSTS